MITMLLILIQTLKFTKILVKLVVGKTYSTDFTRSFLSFCHSFSPFSSICLVIHHILNLNTYKIIVKLLISVDVTRKPIKVEATNYLNRLSENVMWKGAERS